MLISESIQDLRKRVAEDGTFRNPLYAPHVSKLILLYHCFGGSKIFMTLSVLGKKINQLTKIQIIDLPWPRSPM
jgi:hypothetical protein